MNDINKYIGNELQLYGVEELMLTNGKGAGMRLWEVRNGQGLQFTVCPDRCSDIARLSFRGYNFGYFSFGGYTAPSYYDDKDRGWLKSFQAGFLTTCGIYTAGSPSCDEGEMLPLHGGISNTPADHIYWDCDENEIRIHSRMREGRIFSHKLVMERTIVCSKSENVLRLKDTVVNCGDKPTPVMMIYHNNMGYPLLSEDSQVYIPSAEMTPADEYSDKHKNNWKKIYPPIAGLGQQNFYHKLEKGEAGIFNHKIDKGLFMTFDKSVFQNFIQWKAMGERDYVLGLEPTNCHPKGRVKTKENNELFMLNPNEKTEFEINYYMIDGIDEWKKRIE